MTIPNQPYLLHSEFKVEPAGNHAHRLLASIRFGHGEQPLLLDVVRFKIAASYFSFECKDCILPSSQWLFKTEIQRALTFQLGLNHSVGSSSEDAGGLEAKILEKPSIGMSSTTKSGITGSTSTSLTASATIAAVHGQGSDRGPRWHVAALPHLNYLEGTLCDAEGFCTAEPSGQLSGAVRISVRIPRHGVSFATSNEVIAKHPNKLGLIKHLIRLGVTERDFPVATLTIPGLP